VVNASGRLQERIEACATHQRKSREGAVAQELLVRADRRTNNPTDTLCRWRLHAAAAALGSSAETIPSWLRGAITTI